MSLGVALSHSITHCFPGKADIVFLLDSSDRVGPGSFKQELTLFDTVAQAFPVKQDGVNFAGIVYTTRTHVPFQLNTHTDKASLSVAIRGISYIGGGGKAGQAIAAVKSRVLDASGRTGVPKVVVVLMVGKTDDDMVGPAGALKAQGVKIIMLGVGKSVDSSLLGSVASSTDFVLLENSIDDLPGQGAPLVVKINNGMLFNSIGSSWFGMSFNSGFSLVCEALVAQSSGQAPFISLHSCDKMLTTCYVYTRKNLASCQQVVFARSL